MLTSGTSSHSPLNNVSRTNVCPLSRQRMLGMVQNGISFDGSPMRTAEIGFPAVGPSPMMILSSCPDSVIVVIPSPPNNSTGDNGGRLPPVFSKSHSRRVSLAAFGLLWTRCDSIHVSVPCFFGASLVHP